MVPPIYIVDAKRPVGNLRPKVMSKIKLSKAESQSTIEKVFIVLGTHIWRIGFLVIGQEFIWTLASQSAVFKIVVVHIPLF